MEHLDEESTEWIKAHIEDQEKIKNLLSQFDENFIKNILPLDSIKLIANCLFKQNIQVQRNNYNDRVSALNFDLLNSLGYSDDDIVNAIKNKTLKQWNLAVVFPLVNNFVPSPSLIIKERITTNLGTSFFSIFVVSLN